MISFSDMCKQIYHNSIHCIRKISNYVICFKANFSTKEINMLTRQSLQTIYQRRIIYSFFFFLPNTVFAPALFYQDYSNKNQRIVCRIDEMYIFEKLPIR